MKTTWVQLHNGFPGEDGTANVMMGPSRKKKRWWSRRPNAPQPIQRLPTTWNVEDLVARNAWALNWHHMPATDTVRWASVWDEPEEGSPLMFCSVSGGSHLRGDTLYFSPGVITAEFWWL